MGKQAVIVEVMICHFTVSIIFCMWIDLRIGCSLDEDNLSFVSP
jgi:hypothetical protein